MAEAILIKSGGGGVTSDELTATRSQVLEGQTAVTRDSDDEPATGTMLSDSTIASANQLLEGKVAYGRKGTKYVGTLLSDANISSASQMLSGKVGYGKNGTKYTGSLTSMNGGTYTPSKSTQTISCSGKVMNSNIVINPIPTSYVNVSSGYHITNGANWGNALNLGVLAKCRSGNWLTTSYCALPTQDTSSGRLRFNSTNGNSSGYGRSVSGFISKGSIDFTPFKSLVFRLYIRTLDNYGGDLYIYITNQNGEIIKTITRGYGSTVNTQKEEMKEDISGITGQHFIGASISYPGGAGMCAIDLNYMYLSEAAA